jgi:probable phosphoglycerate mutase
MILRIYVTRHGDRSGTEPHPRVDPPLSALGRQQAEATGRRLARLEAGGRAFQIIASPFRRTAQTAEIVAEALACRFRVEPGFCELFHATFTGLKDFRGLDAAEAAAEFDRLANAELLRGKWWPDMPETQEDCDRRAAEAIRRLMPTLESEHAASALLIGHGASCAAIMRCLVPGFSEGGQDCCGLSSVCLNGPGGTPTLEFHNDTTHL